ncbi:Acyltransferase [Teladorsagia circumcincta]|uniref:1-acylglycerol-3-phosphate O-acyltransferase n=1 Tax=Teladorsagia circumcincta TaxID=45464 RepID=A0A2G9TSP2_TELCI|nr:Acyltransferase [Teladorsagia circumcincta]
MDEWTTVLLLFCCATLVILYNVSQWCHYILRISFFYLCIFLHGIECNITMIPSWIAGNGADLIFHTFKYWTLWTGINVDVRGFEENLEKIPDCAVVICNHQSALDVVSMTRVWPPRGTVMMKESLKYIPFFNLTIIPQANAVFVKRFKRGRVSDTIERCVKQMKKYNLKGGFPIVPIVLSNYRPFYSKTDHYFMSDGEVIAQVLSPISTKGLTEEDVPQLSEKVRSMMLDVYYDISKEAAEKMRRKRQQS